MNNHTSTSSETHTYMHTGTLYNPRCSHTSCPNEGTHAYHNFPLCKSCYKEQIVASLPHMGADIVDSTAEELSLI